MAAVFTSEFNTRTLAGAPITLAGSPVVSVYKDSSATQTTTGVTLTVDHDHTGTHLLEIDTADAFYTAGSNFRAKITTGTVDGISVVGTIVFEFSIEARSGLLPANAAQRTVNVTAGGEIDANVQRINDTSLVGDGSGTPFNV